MCPLILESDVFSQCCHWHWRGGGRHRQHQVVIKPWRAGQQSATAGSCVMLLSWVPPKPRPALAPIYGPYLATFAQITPPICSLQVARCPMHVTCCLRASQWFCPSFCAVMGAPTWDSCWFFISSCYMHTNTEVCKVNDFLNECKCGPMSLSSTLKKNMCDFQSFITSTSVQHLLSWNPNLFSCPDLKLEAGGTTTTASSLLQWCFPPCFLVPPEYLIIRFRPAEDQAKHYSRKLLVTSWTIWKDQFSPTTGRAVLPCMADCRCGHSYRNCTKHTKRLYYVLTLAKILFILNNYSSPIATSP